MENEKNCNQTEIMCENILLVASYLRNPLTKLPQSLLWIHCDQPGTPLLACWYLIGLSQVMYDHSIVQLQEHPENLH